MIKNKPESLTEACKNLDDALDKFKKELLIIIYPKISPSLNFLSKLLARYENK